MKLPFLTLTVLSASYSTALAHSLRGRELEPADNLLTRPCTLYRRFTTYGDGSEKESWDCLLDQRDGNAFVAVPDLNLANATSGETTLYAPGMAVIDNAAVIQDPSGAVFGGRRRDRRLSVTGTLQVVVVRITCGSKVVTNSLATIMSDVFSDAACLKSQMAACSNNAVTIVPGPNDGAIDVSISSCADEGAARDATTTALTGLLGKSPDSMANTYFMYCLPPGLGWTGIAYAYVNSWLSVYNDDWCGYVSGQMHEVGHNLNLGHSGEGSVEYGDQTGFMGYSYSADDQQMCYNAPNMYQLGWLKTVSEHTSQPTGTFTLVGHTNVGGGLQAILLRDTPSGQDTYVWFNHATGMNADSQEAMNQVIVNTRPSGVGYSQSLLAAKLDAGGTYNPGNTYYSLRVESIGSSEAVVTFDLPTLPPVPPTTPPTLPPVPPTSPPTLPPVPPTVPPVPPTSPPTLPPPVPPTSPPTLPPVPPTSPPTLPPVPPTSPPTQPPVVVCPKTNKASLCLSPCIYSLNKKCLSPSSCTSFKKIECPTSTCKLANNKCVSK